MNELISIIIPIYNTEQYLSRCLDSVLQQTYQNLEIVCVDDGSTDSSSEIMERYAAKDSRIHVIHKKNGGISETRNLGLDKIHGKYVAFIDSDDQISSEYIAYLHHLLQTYNGDIAVTGYLKLWDISMSDSVKYHSNDIQVFNNIDAIADMWHQKHIGIQPWGKLYRADLFKNIRYPVGKIYEDLAITHLLLWQADKIIYSPEPLYYYCQHQDSIMYRSFDVKNLDRIDAANGLLRWAQENCKELVPAAQTRYFVANIQVLREIPLEKTYEKEIEMIKSNLHHYRKFVYKNSNAKTSVRIMALLSCINVRLLKKLGHLYKLVYK